MNLLAPDRQQHAKRRLALVVARAGAALLLAAVAAGAALLLIGRTILERHFRDVVTESSLVLRTQESAFRNIRATNELLRVLDRANASAVPWSVALRMITDGTPNGVTLHRMTIDRNAVLHLDGRSAMRDDLLAFQEHLRALPMLHDVAIPFGNFLQREEIDFSVDARIDRTAIPHAT